MASGNEIGFENITAEMPVIGFTGALGSGCTYLSEGLAAHFNYNRCSLSTLIHEFAKVQGQAESTENLQDIGNDLRRAHGRDILVRAALTELDSSFPGPDSRKRPRGIIVDGIRNTGEVDALRQFPNFFLFSIHADTDVRKNRTIGPGKRFATEKEFGAADARDRHEETEHGQQVTACNYLADVIVLNHPPEEVSPQAHGPYKQYVQEVLYDAYVKLIEHVSQGRPSYERQAKAEEALMTAAYVESRRSSCLKRKVGAIIASPKGDVVSAGHNEVPETAKPCIDDPRYGWCARDVIQEELGQKMTHCPGCGAEIRIPRYLCKACGTGITDFRKRCPNPECGASVQISHRCSQCGKDVFQEFLPGGGSEKTGRLLEMCRALHAEENAILNLCKVGTALPHLHSDDGANPEGCVLYSTTFPCNLCANKIVTVGIRKVVYAEPYTTKEAETVFSQGGVTLKRFQGVKSRAFFRLYG